MSASPTAAGPHPRIVELGDGMRIGAMGVAAIATAAVVGVAATVLLFEPAAPLRSVAIGAGPLLLIGAIVLLVRVLGPGRASIDLSSRTLRTRGRTVRFDEIHRLVLFPVGRGGDWLALLDVSGRQIARFGATWSVRREMGPAQWRAMHELLWFSAAPGLDRAQDATRGRAPLPGSLDRQGALAIIAAQIAWLEQGGAPDASRAPLHRFVRGV